MANIYEVPTSTKEKLSTPIKLIFILLVVSLTVSIIGLIVAGVALSKSHGSITESSPTVSPSQMEERVAALEDELKKISPSQMEERFAALEEESKKNAEAVGFHAVLSKDTTLQFRSILIFDNIITNYGNAYSGISGTFTAPVHGLYQFTVYFISDSPFPKTTLNILLNDNTQCVAYAQEGQPHLTGTCSALVEVMPGDLINVKVNTVSGAVNGGYYTGFIGQLYKAL